MGLNYYIHARNFFHAIVIVAYHKAPIRNILFDFLVRTYNRPLPCLFTYIVYFQCDMKCLPVSPRGESLVTALLLEVCIWFFDIIFCKVRASLLPLTIDHLLWIYPCHISFCTAWALSSDKFRRLLLNISPGSSTTTLLLVSFIHLFWFQNIFVSVLSLFWFINFTFI